jgi:hypothetical protein
LRKSHWILAFAHYNWLSAVWGWLVLAGIPGGNARHAIAVFLELRRFKSSFSIVKKTLQ